MNRPASVIIGIKELHVWSPRSTTVRRLSVITEENVPTRMDGPSVNVLTVMLVPTVRYALHVMALLVPTSPVPMPIVNATRKIIQHAPVTVASCRNVTAPE